MAAPVHADLEDGVPHVRFTRPEKRNAVNTALADAAIDAMRGFAADGHTFGVISAEGPIFSAGADLTEVGVAPGPHPVERLLAEVSTTSMLWLAVVEAPALGAAVGLVARCPVVLCTPAASFSLPEWRIGIYPSGVVVDMEPLVGPRRAFTVGLTGQPMGATEALQAGLVTEVVDDADLDGRVAAWTDVLRDRSALLADAVASWNLVYDTAAYREQAARREQIMQDQYARRRADR